MYIMSYSNNIKNNVGNTESIPGRAQAPCQE